MLMVERNVTLWGEPVQVTRGEDRFTAPEVIHRASAGTLEARGGVRATLTARDGELLGAAALGEGEGPVMVEAAEATFRETANEVTFRGGVRAWRGTSLLLADQLRGDRAGESLAASGAVKTIWRPVPDADGEVAGEATAEDGEAGPRQPVEISSRHMTYGSTEKSLHYEGDVSVTQGAQTVSCQDLRVELDEEQRPERYDCSGEARVVDQELQRTVEGSLVVYRPGAGEVEVSGEPVKLVDPKLGRIEGPRLWYSIDDGSVRMGAAPSAAADGVPGGPKIETSR
jgi:lipopolysaccharide transport protein LptA